MATVETERCVPCDFLSRPEDVQHALLSTFSEQLGAVTHKTGADGVFVVRVDDEHAVDKIVRRTRDRL